MAGLGIGVGHLSYRTLCGLYFSRHAIRRDHRKDLAAAFSQALEGREA